MSRQWTVQTRANEDAVWTAALTTDRFADAIREYHNQAQPKRLLRGHRVLRMVVTDEQLNLGNED